MGLEAPIIAAIIMGGVAAAGTTAQMVMANQDKQAAKGEANKQRDMMRQMADVEADRAAKAESKVNEDATREAARRRQRALAAGGSGRRDTILTQPLGGSAPVPGQEKTLLGA